MSEVLQAFIDHLRVIVSKVWRQIKRREQGGSTAVDLEAQQNAQEPSDKGLNSYQDWTRQHPCNTLPSLSL